MSTADAAFRAEVEAQAVKCGWSRDAAALIARHAGKPQHRDAQQQRRGPVGKAPKATAGMTLERVLPWFELPVAMAADFRAAGMATVEAATPTLRAFFRAAARSPASARSALAFELLAKRAYQKRTTTS